jgi:hypothetical protein
LNRSQIKALETLKEVSSEEFQRVTSYGRESSNSVAEETESKNPPQINLKDLSAREIHNFRLKLINVEIK